MFESVNTEGMFWRSKVHNSKVTDPIQLEFALIRDFTHVLVTSKFDDDLIKNECGSLETPIPHY